MTKGAVLQYSYDNITWFTGTILLINETKTVYAKATKDGMVDSDVVSATYISTAVATTTSTNAASTTTSISGSTSTTNFTGSTSTTNISSSTVGSSTTNAATSTSTTNASTSTTSTSTTTTVTTTIITTTTTTSINYEDKEPPYKSNNYIAYSNISGDQLTASWVPATDNLTPENELEYKLINNKDNLTTNELYYYTGNNIIFDWTKNIFSYIITGLTKLTAYDFTVLVRDSCGNYSRYYTSPKIKTMNIEIVDTIGKVGYFPALGLDSFNLPHIVYLDISLFTLKYAKKNINNQWILKTLDSNDFRTKPSIFIDNNDIIHIVARSDSPNYKLIYFYSQNDDFTKEIVNDEGGINPKIIVANNKIYIFCIINSKLCYFVKENNIWQKNIIENNVSSSAWNNIAVSIDENHNIHLVYMDFNSIDNNGFETNINSLMYANNIYGNFVYTKISDYSKYTNSIGEVDLIIDKNNCVHIINGLGENLYYINNKDGWNSKVIFYASSDYIRGVSIAKDNNDKIKIIFNELQSLYFLEEDDNFQTKYSVDQFSSDNCQSIKIDSLNKTHISYFRYDSDLYYASW